MKLFGRRTKVPPIIAQATVAAERPLVAAPAADDIMLAASRFGLWVAENGAAERWDWAVISKASLRDRRLSVTRADQLDTWEAADWPDGIAVLRDRPTRPFHLLDGSGITDVVHTRVRRSVAAAREVPGLGWVVLRRIAGRDGLHPQIRLDPGVLETGPVHLDTAVRVLAALRPPDLLD